MTEPLPLYSRRVALFRCDGGINLGGGHIRRCLTLAGELRALGWSIAFAVRGETLDIAPTLKRLVDRLIILSGPPEQEPKEIGDALGGSCGMLVVDHFERDARFETPCRDWAERIAVIDDLADRTHDADTLIDGTFGRDEQDYRHLVPPHCRLLLGSAYALLRREFARLRPMTLRRRQTLSPVGRVIVSCGATDPDNLSCTVLEAIDEMALGLDVAVVLGRGAPHAGAVRRQAAAMCGRVQVHVDASNMAQLMAQADLAIGAGGSTAWERCALGLPTILITTAGNQRFVARALAESGAAWRIGAAETVTKGDITAAIVDLTRDEYARTTMVEAAAAMCDGLGAARVAMALAPGISSGGGPVRLRPAAMDDAEMLFQWQTHPETRRFALNPESPTWEGHLCWLAGKLADHQGTFSIVMADDEPAGALRLDRTRFAGIGDGYEVSIVVAPEQRRLGIGRCALEAARRLLPEAVLFARVKPRNAASIRAFLATGYERRRGVFVHWPAGTPGRKACARPSRSRAAPGRPRLFARP